MRRLPPTFHPGPLTYAQAEALNQLARDLYGSLLDKFSAAPPLQVRQGIDGVAHSIETTALANTLVSGGLVAPPGGSSCWPAYSAGLDVDVNDYNPSSLLWWRLTRGSVGAGAPANVNITGLLAPGVGADGCPFLITHEGLTGGGNTTSTITLKGSSTASAPGGRFTPASDLVLKDGDSVLVRYDKDLLRYRFLYYPAASLTQAGLVSLVDQNLGAGKKAVPDKFGVGVGVSSILANSALQVMGYTYAYFAGIISFGGGNSPLAESAGAILQYAAGVSPQITLTIAGPDYVSGVVGGIIIDGPGHRLVIRHSGAANKRIAWYNDNTLAYEEGVTGTGGGGDTFVGGIATGLGSDTNTLQSQIFGS